MPKYSSYLVCKNHIQEVKKFLSQFFEEINGRYNHEEWITFKPPEDNFLINLMVGEEQKLTQNMTFEIWCDSMDELEEYANEYNKEIRSFIATETDTNFKYNFIEIIGPENICKMEINYMQGLQ